MKHKNILITGVTSGIGLETAKALAKQQHTIFFPARNEEKARTTQQFLQEIGGHDRIFYKICDLASLKEVREYTASLVAQDKQFDVVLLNAGVFPSKQRFTQDGFELGWGVNYLAQLLMLQLLLEHNKIADQGRIILVSSTVHKSGKIDLADLEQKERKFSMIQFYATNKLAQILMMKELDQRLKDKDITINALHPGVIATNIARDLPKWMNWLFGIFFKNPEQGAATHIFLASDPSVAGISGKYFVNKKPAAYNPLADDAAFRTEFWEASMQQIKSFLYL